MEIETLQTLELLILFFFFGIELAQIKLDKLVEDVMNLDINKESMDVIMVIVRISLLFAQIFSILILSIWRVPRILYFFLNYVILFLLNFVILNLS